ncbi:cobalt transporter CbiM [Deltaproteobacteria bacterium]|nr:cobalt transporter CbiM [Deltaproteobacteria bacterium]
MHIADGVLSPAVLGTGAALAAVGTAVGLRRLDYDRLMTVAMLSAAFLVASLVHVPVGFSSMHLILNGLLGVLLGFAAFPAILAALALQALLFQYGGLTILGVNTFCMAFSGVLAGYCFKAVARICPGPKGQKAAAFCGGALGVALAGLFTASALAFSDEGFITTAQLLFLTHLPVMLVEGIITMFMASFIARVRPEMLHWR